MDDIYKIHFTEICKMYNKSAIVKKKMISLINVQPTKKKSKINKLP